jgi:hypothetical protein
MKFMQTTFAALLAIALVGSTCSRAADAGAPTAVDIVISPGSVQVNGVELRNIPPDDDPRFFSLAAAEKALGHAPASYQVAPDVRAYSWPTLGIALLLGQRGVEKGKLFKFQVWFDDEYDKKARKHSGKFSGHVHVDGVDVGPETTFDSIGSGLKANGYSVTDPYVAIQKKEISLFGNATTKKIQRIEIWPFR